MYRCRSFTLLTIIFGIFFLAPNIYAETITPGGDGSEKFQDLKAQTGAFVGSKGANLGTPKDPREAVAGIIRTFLGLLGTLFLAYMVYGGYLFLTSAGMEERVEKGKHIIKNSVIGLVLILGAYSITWFVTWLFVATGNQEYEGTFIEQKVNTNSDPLDSNVSPQFPKAH